VRNLADGLLCCIDETKGVTVNAEQSYDPDFPSDPLEFAWKCTTGNHSHYCLITKLVYALSVLEKKL